MHFRHFFSEKVFFGMNELVGVASALCSKAKFSIKSFEEHIIGAVDQHVWGDNKT